MPETATGVTGTAVGVHVIVEGVPGTTVGVPGTAVGVPGTADGVPGTVGGATVLRGLMGMLCDPTLGCAARGIKVVAPLETFKIRNSSGPVRRTPG